MIRNLINTAKVLECQKLVQTQVYFKTSYIRQPQLKYRTCVPIYPPPGLNLEIPEYLIQNVKKQDKSTKAYYKLMIKLKIEIVYYRMDYNHDICILERDIYFHQNLKDFYLINDISRQQYYYQYQIEWETELFLKRIGGGTSEYADKFESLSEVFTFTSKQMADKGVPPKARKYILNVKEQLKRGVLTFEYLSRRTCLDQLKD